MHSKLLVATMMFGPLALGACGHGPRHGHHQMSAEEINRKLEVFFDYIDATADQRAQIQRQLAGVASKAEALRKAHRRERAELLALWRGERLDKAALRARLDRKLEQFRRLGYTLVEAVVDVHAVLTPDQRAKLAKAIEAHAHH